MWTCTACSYADNIDARTRCELCEAVKPAGARAAAPMPSGPSQNNSGQQPTAAAGGLGSWFKWACTMCTLENVGSVSACTACGTPKPAAFQATRAAPPAQPIRLPPSAATPNAHVPSRPAAAAPAATRTTSVSRTGASPSPSPSPPPARSAAAPAASTSPTPPESDVLFLLSMGFERARCLAALKVKPNREAALDWLLSQDAQEEAKSKPAAASSKPSPSPPAAAAAAAKPAAKPATKPTAASSAASSSSSKSASVVAPLRQMSLSEQQEFAQREAKRLELLKLLEEEAAAKIAKSRAKAAAAAATAAPVATATKKPTTAPVKATPASAAPPPAAEAPREDNLTPEERRLAKIAAARATEVERVRLAKLRVQKRLAAESELRDVPSVCRALQSNYDALRYIGIIQMLVRIIDKVVADGGATDKFRRIPLSNPKLDLTLVRPIGAIWILKQAGFQEQVVEKEDRMDTSEGNEASDATTVEEQRVLYLPSEKVNLSLLKRISSQLQQSLVSQSSSLPTIFDEIIANGTHSVEAVYLLALEVRLLLKNILVSTDEIDEVRQAAAAAAAEADDNTMSDSPTASSARTRRLADGVNRNFRTIDKREAFYQNRIKPIFESRRILADIGFVLDEHDATRNFLIVPFEQVSTEDGVRRYQVMLREVNGVIARLQSQTPIAVGLRQLCARNRQKATSRFIDIFFAAIRLVLATPHEQKYHRIVLDKVQAKIGTAPAQIVNGMEEFVKLFDFLPQTAADGTVDTRRVALTYPGFDPELLRWRFEEAERNWQQLVEQAAAETGGAASWSFD